MPDAPDDGKEATAPVDYDVLDRIGGRLAAGEQFEDVTFRPGYAPESVVVECNTGYYPAAVERAALRVRWFENDDFSVHYAEEYADGDRWECRWDRHPNPHNVRDHFHPPPDAGTPGDDEDYPTDWRDVLTRVLDVLEERIRAFWE